MNDYIFDSELIIEAADTEATSTEGIISNSTQYNKMSDAESDRMKFPWKYGKDGNRLVNDNILTIRNNTYNYPTRNGYINSLNDETRIMNSLTNHYASKKKLIKMQREEDWNRRIEFAAMSLENTSIVVMSKNEVSPLEIDENMIPKELYNVVVKLSAYYDMNYSFILFVILHLIEVAVHGRVCAKMNDTWIVPMCSYGIAIAHSGAMKTPLMNLLKKPFEDFISNKRNKDYKENEKIKKYNRILDKMIKEAERRAVKEINELINDSNEDSFDDKFETIMSFIDQNSEKINRHKKSTYSNPQIFFSKITEERMFEVLAEQGGHIAFCEAEPHSLTNGVCKNHSTIVLSAHDHEEIIYDTKTSGRVTIEKPGMTILQMAQPSVAQSFYHNGYEDEDIGFIARFIPCFCHESTTQDKVSPEEVNDVLAKEFYPRVTALLERYFSQDISLEKKYIPVPNMIIDFPIYNLKREMNDMIRSKKYDFMQEYLRKAHGQAVRYAAAIHAFNNAYDEIEKKPLSDKEINFGVVMMKALIPHAEHIFDRKKFVAKQNAIKIIDRLLNSTMNEDNLSLDTRFVTQMTNIKKDALMDALGVLEAYNVCRIIPEQGRSAVILIHPNFYSAYRNSPEWK